MSTWFAKFQRFWRDESGPTAVEYAVMLALIIVVCATAITTLGQKVNSTYDNAILKSALGGS